MNYRNKYFFYLNEKGKNTYRLPVYGRFEDMEFEDKYYFKIMKYGKMGRYEKDIHHFELSDIIDRKMEIYDTEDDLHENVSYRLASLISSD